MNTQEKLKLVRQLLEGLVESPNAKAQQALEVLDCSGLPFALTTQFTDDSARELLQSLGLRLNVKTGQPGSVPQDVV